MFVTTNMQNRMPIFENPAYAREAIETLYRVQAIHPFSLFGFVVMLDHCHFLLEVEAPERISTIMNVFKGVTSLNIGQGKIWQPRFRIDMAEHPFVVLRYIHDNPVKAGYCEKPEDYPWSSANKKWNVLPLDQYL